MKPAASSNKNEEEPGKKDLIPYYTEVLKLKKPVSPTEDYNKLKHTPESTTLPPMLSPGRIASTPADGYTPLNDATKPHNTESSPPPPVPPTLNEKDVPQITLSMAMAGGRAPQGGNRGDTGEILYYNDAAAPKGSGDDSRNKLPKGDGQYANC